MVDEERVVTRRTVATPRAAPLVEQDVMTTERVARYPSGGEMLRRAVVFVFGVIQVLLLLRILGMLIDANRNNAIVGFIFDLTAILVAPFEGIIRTETVESGASVLDVTAIVALVGWTILELIVLAGISVLRREPT